MGELLAVRWRNVDFDRQSVQVNASYTHGPLDVPKSGRGRSVPLIDSVGSVLAKLSQRDHFAGPDDLVFVGSGGSHLDASALRRRYNRAREGRTRPLRFHDLRHTFGTYAIRTADPRALQHWMGHAQFSTTEIYLSYKPQADAARRLGQAFEVCRNRSGCSADAERFEPATFEMSPAREWSPTFRGVRIHAGFALGSCP